MKVGLFVVKQINVLSEAEPDGKHFSPVCTCQFFYLPASFPSSVASRCSCLCSHVALNYSYNMTSPPDSGPLFFSSSPTRYSSGPAEEVDTVLAQAQKVTQLDPQVNAILSLNRGAFFETFSRRVELVKSRSQAFQDCHVTVFDKVLLILTENGKDLDNTAAISYFCEEHLGIPFSAAPAQKKAIVSNALISPPIVTQGML